MITDPRRQRTEDHPDEFDAWVYGIVAGTIPSLTAAEDHRTLWQPILDRGPPAHQWIERFFWEWFTVGVRAAQTPERFTAIWSAMIEHALHSPAWDPATGRSYDLDDAVFWLVGLGTRINKIGERPEFAAAISGMESLFARVAERWFKKSKLVSGFLYWVTQPAAVGLLVPAIRWFAPVIPTFNSYDWRDGLEGNLISFLWACWERKREQISADPDLETGFSRIAGNCRFPGEPRRYRASGSCRRFGRCLSIAMQASDPGLKMRMDILRRDAERKIFEKLRIHNWAEKIEREFTDGLIISAERGGHRHIIALIYSSATDNKVYKSLAAEVENIFFNGEPHLVEQFTHGITKPVGSADDFHEVLLEWNRLSAEGKFASDGHEMPPAADPTILRPRLLLADEPIEAIWLRLRQLQSVTLARKMIEARAAAEHVVLDTDSLQSKAQGVAYALRNASDYFQAKDGQPFSQRVLNLYYGSLSFAFAEMLAAPRGAKALSDIEDSTKAGHGTLYR